MTDAWRMIHGAVETALRAAAEGNFCWFRSPHAAVETKTGELT